MDFIQQAGYAPAQHQDLATCCLLERGQEYVGGVVYKPGLGSRSRSEPGVFGSLEPEPEPLEKKPGAGTGAGAAWKKDRSRSR